MKNSIQVKSEYALEAKLDVLLKDELLSEVEILEKLEKARENAAQGIYKEATDVSHDMKEKYGL